MGEERMFLPNGRIDGDDYSYETHAFFGGSTVQVRVHPIYEDGSHGLPERIISMPYSPRRKTASLAQLEAARKQSERSDMENGRY